MADLNADRLAGLVLAAPGGVAAGAGGRRYGVRLIEELRKRGRKAAALALPDLAPAASAEALAATIELLAAVPHDATLVVDGRALGALHADAIASLGRPVVALAHHPVSMEPGLPPDDAARLGASERAAFAKAAVVIVTSAATRALLVERFGVAKARLRVAEPGVDPAPRSRGSGGAPVILTVATVTPRKNHVALAHALGLLGDVAWRWRVAGSLTVDPHYADALRAELARQGVADRVELLGDLDEAGLAAAYDGADLFALPSRLEGYGAAYAEALARALPVVAGAGEAAAALVPANAGALVPPDDPAAIAAALRPLLADPDALAKAARAARSAGARLPRWFQCADVFEHLMDQGAGRV